MMITWRYSKMAFHSYQLASVALSTLILAKSCTDHHFFEISAKNVKGNTANALTFEYNYIFSENTILPDDYKTTLQHCPHSTQRFRDCSSCGLSSVLGTCCSWDHGHCQLYLIQHHNQDRRQQTHLDRFCCCSPSKLFCIS